MDKDRAHALARAAGVRVPSSFLLPPGFEEASALERAEALGYPLFVKPVRAGSSYGISKVAEPESLLSAISRAFLYDNQVIVEEAIPGFEVGCAVMGNETLTTGEIDEVELTEGFFDFTEKYQLLTSKIHVPARIPDGLAEALKRPVKSFLTPEGGIVFNEVNTIPGFTAHSRFPRMMAAAGVPFEQVVSQAVELAVRP